MTGREGYLRMTKAEKISALLAVVLIIVCAFAAFRPSESGITSERSADTAEIMTGGDGESSDELLPGDKININTANLETLCLLPGIGETIGQRIIDRRDANGSFSSADELIEIEGIGENTLDEIRTYISLEDDAP